VNPFDLRGPEFLLFYGILSAVVIGALVLFRRASESGGAAKIDLADPYLIACLRGGNVEVIRVALVSLIDRGLLLINGTQISCAENVSPDSVRRDIDRALIKECAKPREVSDILADSQLRRACEQYEEKLKGDRLLPDESVIQRRLLLKLIAILILGAVGAIKIIVAIERGRTNVGFLIMLMLIAIGLVALVVSFPRLTTAGSNMLADIQNLYSGLKARAASIRPGGATIDAMMLAAAFGVGALEAESFPYTRRLFPAAQSSASDWSPWINSSGSSCGGSCGSSCGGGGCGGGCGGCGS
jgi:uncharacterized protein (TIGR04222 family)